MYACAELATAVRYGINLITLVFTDNAFVHSRATSTIQRKDSYLTFNHSLSPSCSAKGMKADPSI
jgi:thiamine pyrophosphate-dependent acetolactate synthase large subunit-like protein